MRWKNRNFVSYFCLQKGCAKINKAGRINNRRLRPLKTENGSGSMKGIHMAKRSGMGFILAVALLWPLAAVAAVYTLSSAPDS
ncbi:MAG: hypothetical protein K2H65_04875, partial [Bacteroidales bacterium]|nr:hypothetical protein [Bacteroidales bacterium]